MIWKIELVLANARHVRNVPGRKTDMNDSVWLADLLAHGLVKGSFVPPTPVQQLRDLTRTRTQLTREVAQHVQRIQKTLEDANVKLTSVLTDIMGKSGRRIVEAIATGQADPQALASLAHATVKAKPEALAEALQGKVTEHIGFCSHCVCNRSTHWKRPSRGSKRVSASTSPLFAKRWCS